MPEQTLRPKPQLRQRLSPKLISRLKIAELSLAELSEYAHYEINSNPLLRDPADNLDKKIKEAIASKSTNFKQTTYNSYLKIPKDADLNDYLSSPTVTADAEIRIRKDSFDIHLNDHGLPKLNINPLYRKILENPDSSSETKEFVKEQLRKAIAFIDAVEKRRISLKKIIRFTAQTQKDFLTKKSRHLHPLALRDLARKSNLHVSTVSRIVRQKRILINGEVILLKNLLSSPFKKNPCLSTRSVFHRLREILKDSKTQKPPSDQRISLQLKKEGIFIARRTVTKYRRILGIPSSFERKIN